MARLPIPGSDVNKWGEVLNDFLLATHHSVGTLRQEVLTTALESSFVPFTSTGGISVVSGTFQGAVTIPSSTFAIGNAVAQDGAKLYIETPISQVGVLFRNTTAGGNAAANLVSQVQTPTSRVFQAGLQSDSINRISIEGSGLVEWGAGGLSGRDTNLYRSAVNTLRTDGSFKALQLEVGPSSGFGNGVSMVRDTTQVGRIDNNQVSGGGMRVQAMTGSLQLRGSANTGIQIAATSIAFDTSMNIGFFGVTPIARPSGVAVSATSIHAALVSLGLIAP